MKRIAGAVLTLVLIAVLPSVALAHGGHAEAGTGLLHTVVHALPVLAVLVVAALVVRLGASTLAARGRR